MTASKHERAHRWRRLLAIAGRTANYLTIEQILELGYSKKQIAHSVAIGQLESAARGVYRVPGPVTWESKLHFQTVGRDLLVGGLSAAMVDELARPADISPGFAEFVSGKRMRTRLDAARIYVVDDYQQLPVSKTSGLRTTTIDRTLIDIAAHHELTKFQVCFNAAIRKRLISVDRFRRAVQTDDRIRGRAALERALESIGGEIVAPSDWSHWAKQRITDFGLPEPQMEVTMHDARGRRIGRVDFYWPELRLVVELDGREFHSDPAAFERDRNRDARLLGIGVSVIRFTWTQYNDGQYFEQTIAEAISQRPKTYDRILGGVKTHKEST